MLAVADHTLWATLGELLGRNVTDMKSHILTYIWMQVCGHIPTYHDAVAALEG